jgi:hypothetical protein
MKYPLGFFIAACVSALLGAALYDWRPNKENVPQALWLISLACIIVSVFALLGGK